MFDSQQALNDAFKAGALDRDFVAVVRFQGPKANGMPELHKLTTVLGVLQDRGHKVALVTDGRMSGASRQGAGGDPRDARSARGRRHRQDPRRRHDPARRRRRHAGGAGADQELATRMAPAIDLSATSTASAASCSPASGSWPAAPTMAPARSGWADATPQGPARSTRQALKLCSTTAPSARSARRP